MQQLCQENVDWDEPLSDQIISQWQRWRSEVQKLVKVYIPRCLKQTDFGTAIVQELHHFADASTVGYGECSYLRQINGNGKISVALVMAKSRVTPSKITTIPRLELQAGVLSARMSSFLRKEIQFPHLKEFFWTDSSAVLGYIRNDAKRFKV